MTTSDALFLSGLIATCDRLARENRMSAHSGGTVLTDANRAAERNSALLTRLLQNRLGAGDAPELVEFARTLEDGERV